MLIGEPFEGAAGVQETIGAQVAALSVIVNSRCPRISWTFFRRCGGTAWHRHQQPSRSRPTTTAREVDHSPPTVASRILQALHAASQLTHLILPQHHRQRVMKSDDV